MNRLQTIEIFRGEPTLSSREGVWQYVEIIMFHMSTVYLSPIDLAQCVYWQLHFCQKTASCFGGKKSLLGGFLTPLRIPVVSWSSKPSAIHNSTNQIHREIFCNDHHGYKPRIQESKSWVVILQVGTPHSFNLSSSKVNPWWLLSAGGEDDFVSPGAQAKSQWCDATEGVSLWKSWLPWWFDMFLGFCPYYLGKWSNLII